MELSREFFEMLIRDFSGRIISLIIIVVILAITKRVGLALIKRLFSLKISRLTRATEQSLQQKETIKHLFINVFKYAINLLGLVLVISVFVPVGTLMASVGAFALIITFAFQNMLADMVRGFFIIFEEMFMIGDLVDIATFQGEVLEIGLRTTKLKKANGEIVLIPNNNIGNIVKLSSLPVEAEEE